MSASSKSKTNPGHYFEDFQLDQEIVHATPRTITEGDQALYMALYGSRFPLHCSAEMAMDIGFDDMPLEDLLVFHIVFGKSVPDISLNAVANLGYAECVFGVPVYAGDTLRATSRVIGLKENSNRKTGVVYVRTTGVNQDDEVVVDFVRWVMVRKREAGDDSLPLMPPVLPDVMDVVPAADLIVPDDLDLNDYDPELVGQADLWDDYAVGEKIDHQTGMTLEEAEHQMATRLYQNTAKVHFNQFAQAQGPVGRRLVYGGHIISLARAMSFNGLANGFRLAAINAGSHTNPSFAGDTIHAWTEVLDKMELPDRSDVGALRLRTVAVKDQDCEDFPYRDEDGVYLGSVVLDLDYTVLIPRRT
ncbi:MaoC family dehydratase [Roseospira marina]|uniref:MaoC family dehydratase n=1 Tax=Roseospira marina TaxID=140057 RepID=A0A5M6I9Z5_9PROT|nr:MaoC family dehydratase [Roseospira marina]KAA5604498.1 MaoC family dehydratase [Roseospira marina]MBB4315554.1 2-methylfumaryl-CoA hydratase [Roseospira marina]MBB5088509.1 2-methylfumaryl-CoA hydratase [Roseospira marina]